MSLGDEKGLFEAIEIFESKFTKWLVRRLEEKGVSIKENLSFTEILKEYEIKWNDDHQHINPLQNWAREKDKCKSLVSKNFLDKNEFDLLEKTAMNGAVLLLTFQSN